MNVVFSFNYSYWDKMSGHMITSGMNWVL